MDTKAGRLKLDRAHRSSAPKPGVDQRPRPLIMKFHNYADKQRVMEAARRLRSHQSNKESPACKESKISFFNDYSAEVVRRRKAYPVTLRVMVNGTHRRFNTPKEAVSLLHSLEQRQEDTTPQ